MGLNLLCKSTVCQVLMQTFKGFYECTKKTTCRFKGRFGIGNEVYASFLLALYIAIKIQTMPIADPIATNENK